MSLGELLSRKGDRSFSIDAMDFVKGCQQEDPWPVAVELFGSAPADWCAIFLSLVGLSIPMCSHVEANELQ